MGHIYLYTGNAGGKTTTSLGITLRHLGHRKNVYIMQLLKWKEDTGEMLFAHKWANLLETAGIDDGSYPQIKITQWGRKGWIGLSNLTNEDKEKVQAAMFTLEWIADNWEKKIFHPDLIILDEINLVCNIGLLSEEELFRIMQKFPSTVNWVFTGRNATPKLIEKADIVNNIDEIKSPKNMICEMGIQW